MEEQKEFKYTIGEKVYYQRKLVLGQVNQLIELTKGLEFPEDINVLSLVTTLGDKLTKAIGVVLSEAGIPLKQKVLSDVIADIEFELTPEMALEVVSNFFDCNQISSLLNRIGEVMEEIAEKTKIQKTEEQKDSAQFSQEETSPKETISSGDTL